MRFHPTIWTFTIVALIVPATSACGLFRSSPEPVTITRASYQPFDAKYRGVTLGRTMQYFDEQPTVTEFGFEYFVSADVDTGGQALTATLVLDSVLLFQEATGGLSQAQVDAARGATHRANMERDGHLTEFVGPDQYGGLPKELADRVLKTFFPKLPAQGAEPGATWSDTMDTRMVVNGLENDIRLISDHHANEWTYRGGERALHILTVSNYTFSGSGVQSGRAFTVEGTGRRHIHRYVSETGRYLGMVSADTSEGEACITDMDIVIPIHQTRIDSLTAR